MASPRTSVPLGWPQLRLLQIIYEPFQQGAVWPRFQHVNALAWHELKGPSGEPLEPRDVYFELSAFGMVRPPADRLRAAQLRDDTEVRVSLVGLIHLDRASLEDLSNFVNALRYIGERAHNFHPADPTVAERLAITSEEIRLTLRLDTADRGLLRLAHLLQGEASGVWSSFAGPDPGAGWSLDVDTAIARHYRSVVTALDVVAVQEELRRAYAPAVPVAILELETPDHPMSVDESTAPRVFISYSHHDQEFVQALVEQLKQRGIRVWIDQVELVVGDSLITRIGDAIQEGDFVVGVISEHSVRSPWCQKELALAVTRGINEKRVTVLPIRLGDVEMPSFLTDVLYASGPSPAAIAEDLGRGIETHLRRAGIDTAVVPPAMRAQRAAPATVAVPPGSAPDAVPAPDRIALATLLDQIAERADELLIQWDRCRNAGAGTDELTAEQRRLRTLVARLPRELSRALPIVTQLADATWQGYFRAVASNDAEPDLREELRAVRAQVEGGLPVVPRWRIVAGPDQVSTSRDAAAYLLRIERDGDNRPVVVYISGTAISSANEYLPADVVSAKTTSGRSVVVNLLGVDDPPREVTVSTEGIRWS